MDEYDEARDYYRKALTIYIKSYGKFHASVANVVNNMATIFDDLDEHEAAAHFYEQSISIMKRVYGLRSPLLLPSLENLASLLEDQGVYESAAELRREAEDIATGPSHRNIGNVDISPLASPAPSSGKPGSASTDGESSSTTVEGVSAMKDGNDTSSVAGESSSGSTCVVM